jgi:malic enzyme
MWVPRMLLLALGLLLLKLPVITAMASSGAGAAAVAVAAAAAAGEASKPPPPVAGISAPPSVLVLDVDGTLYDASTGLESEVCGWIRRATGLDMPPSIRLS